MEPLLTDMSVPGILGALVLLGVVTPLRASVLPNIVFILTDDQDVELNGQDPIVKTRELIAARGMTFTHMYVSSPLCCPSRSSILTGKYVHNHHGINNSVSGGCSSPEWQQMNEVAAFPVYLKKQGYSTFFAGKYLNQYGFPQTGGVKHVPPGWDWWVGLVGNSVYYNYTLSINGTAEKHGDVYERDYLTDVIHRRGQEFLEMQSRDSLSPFFMMLSTPACHDPFTPAPQYNSTFSDARAPRGGSFNLHAEDKHWLIQQALTPMPDDTIEYIDTTFRNRWRTLQSLDDMVEGVVKTLDTKGMLDNTYIFFSSDNGFHLGQFSMPYDKRQAYEFDVKVPLMVRGPGISKDVVISDSVLNIDLAPTFLELAGATPPASMDGMSLLPILNGTKDPSVPFRVQFLTEHSGVGSDSVPNCPQYNGQGMMVCKMHCVCQDSRNNTYTCLRYRSNSVDYKYCEFEDDNVSTDDSPTEVTMETKRFQELYDLKKDRYELTNIVHQASPEILAVLKTNLNEMKICTGDSCHGANSHHIR
ncbi:N-acetylglucosamine-6-sulfatase-like isoform X1 [Haliotis rufescens]|uniref:N-acetylglucosamine-6-sulfatase-like isoform X1 n=1 Tax=Haliotis rufescens TaxID=6454 RepID=UPI00201F318E|nr:N-acetylglucosamine-6-sulfatase-like isoform X1 [Haliotis rufescens]